MRVLVVDDDPDFVESVKDLWRVQVTQSLLPGMDKRQSNTSARMT